MGNIKNYIPRAFAELANWLVRFIGYLEVNVERLGIDPAFAEALKTKINNYLASFVKANSAEASKADRLYRKEQADAVDAAVRDFVNKYLRYNDRVTNEDRLSLGLPIPDHTPTPLTPPTSWPEALIELPGIRRVSAGFRDYGSLVRGKPDHMQGCEIRYLISDTPPASIDDMPASVFSTRSPYIFTFDESQRGKTVYFCLRRENTRGQKGPRSAIYSAIIP
jgi:hypothetical protein